MANIRSVELTDKSALYEVCVSTGDSGNDAHGHHPHDEMLGDVFVGPYVELATTTSFAMVNENNFGVGYGLTTINTVEFEEKCERLWWPNIQQKYEEFRESDLDSFLIREIFHPSKSPTKVLADFPSHGHIDLLPKYQGQGFGRLMMATMENCLQEMGSRGFHLRVSAHNDRALKFYDAIGYSVLSRTNSEVTVGKRLN
ncbi:MAG: N-acetyltransferase [Actinomycetes bacterium]